MTRVDASQVLRWSRAALLAVMSQVPQHPLASITARSSRRDDWALKQPRAQQAGTLARQACPLLPAQSFTPEAPRLLTWSAGARPRLETY